MRLILFFLALLCTPALAQEPVAVIFGQQLPPGPPSETAKQLFDRIMPIFAREQAIRWKLEATPEELEVMKKLMPEQQAPSGSRDIAGDFFRSLITHFKLNRALYQKYGGRVALSAFGFHVAIDGMIAQLKELERTGQFEIRQPDQRTAFYALLSKLPGDGVTTGKNATFAFQNPPWEKR